jgi:hypothetical protein
VADGLRRRNHTAWGLRKPAYCYNIFGLRRFTIHSDSTAPAGDHQVRLEFGYDGGGLGKGGTVDLYLDGSKVGTGMVEATVPMLFSADETLDLGSDTATRRRSCASRMG